MGFVALFSVILLLFSSLVLSSLGKLLDSLWPEPIAEFTLYLCSCRNKSEIWKGGSVWTTRTEQYNLYFNLLSKKISVLFDLATPGVSGGNSNDSFMLRVTKLWAANQIIV